MPAVEELDYGYSLVGSLRKDLRMLQGFPTVVQELIQNAEDAQADTFWMDFTSQALRVGNSGEFEDEHFDRIIEIASGGKRHDPDSIGSFGVGFVSVYQVTDEPHIYSRGQVRILQPQRGKAIKGTGVEHEWPSTFILPWATEATDLRGKLEVEPVDLTQIDTFIEETRDAFSRSAVFLRHIKALHLLRDGEPIETLMLTSSGSNDAVVTASSGTTTYRMYQVPLNQEVQQEAHRRGRRTILQLALPLEEPDAKGLLYAFLPTRDEIGLPLHINADFYPNTDRKGLLWDEADKRGWNEQLLDSVVDFVPQLLTDLAQHSPEALYTFADRVRLAASRMSSSPHPVARFVQRLWSACQLAFRHHPLFWSQTGEWITHDVFLRIPHSASPLLEKALLTVTHWHLPPDEHKGFRTLFRMLEVQGLDGASFVDALEQLFGEDVAWLAADERWSMLEAVFDYLGQLGEHQKGWQEKITDLDQRLGRLTLALTAEGELQPIADVWTCPEAYVPVAAPWLGADALVDRAWLDKAPSLLHQGLNVYEPIDLVQDLEGAANIPELVASGWPLSKAYTFLKTDPQLGGQRLRNLAIYRTTAGTYCKGEDLAIPAQIDDRFHVRKLLDVGSMRGHEDLLERLALPLLDASTYYGRLLPEFFRQNPGRRREVIEAIAKVYSGDNFPLNDWKPLSCAELTSGAWVCPEQAYWPDELLASLFEDGYPSFSAEQYQGRGVRPLMAELGMRMSVSDKDIVDVLQQRAQEAVNEKSIHLRRKVLNHALQAPTSTLTTYLSKLKWLPAKGAQGWHAPGELLRAEDEELVGQRLEGKHLSLLLLPERQAVKNENLRALGFARPTAAQVMAHIRDLNSRHRGPSGRILNWLNSHAFNIQGNVRQDLQALQVFPLGEGKFAPPSHLFRQDPKLGRWRYQVGAGELERFTPLLDALQVPHAPQPRHYRDVLLEIAGRYGAGDVPQKDDQEIAEQCFKALSDAYSQSDTSMSEIIDSLRGKRVVPVYWKERTRGSLVKAENALYLDKPVGELSRFGLPERFDARTRDVGTPGFFTAIGVRTVSSVWKLTYRFPAGALKSMTDQTKRLGQMLPVLLRLGLKVHRRISVNDLRDRIHRFRFFRCDVIPASVELEGFRLSGTCELSYAADMVAGRLYIRDLNQADTAKALAEMLSLQDASDRAVLRSIWSMPLEDAQEYLTEAQFPELPEEYVPIEIASGETAAVETFPEEDAPAEAADAQEVARPPSEADNSPVRTPVTNKEADYSGPGRQKAGNTSPRPDAQEKGKQPSSAGSTSSPQKHGKTPHQASAAGAGKEPRPSESAGKPHPGRSSASPSRQQRFRNYTYVYEGPEENEAETHAREVDRRGMEYVLSHERRRGHHPEDVSLDYGAGYDIRSADQDGVIRYIELKTMSGEWRERGVALSANQHAMAQRQKSQYWLYVIENLDGDPVLHEIQNPFERVTSYTFDDSWKQAPTAEEDVLLG